MELVKYYTLVLEIDNDTESEEISETEDFFGRFENEDKFSDDIENLAYWLEEIGKKRSAKEHFFRFEDSANALPPPKRVTRQDSGKLRLYCIRLSDNIVILCNGDEKTANEAQKCPNVFPKFRLARSIAIQIDKHFSDKSLRIEGKELIGYEDLILYY